MNVIRIPLVALIRSETCQSYTWSISLILDGLGQIPVKDRKNFPKNSRILEKLHEIPNSHALFPKPWEKELHLSCIKDEWFICKDGSFKIRITDMVYHDY